MSGLILSAERSQHFITENTSLIRPQHVPEVRLFLADEAHALWHKTEEELTEIGLPPPYWAFAWAGGQGVARYILDHPECVLNKRVLDFASGSGLVGIAAALCGAQLVVANDIDPFARHAIYLNAAQNNVSLQFDDRDLIGKVGEWDVVLAGDVFYDKPLADRLIPWFDALAISGTKIIVGDPGRSYLPRQLLTELSIYSVPVSRALEDADVKRTTVWRYNSPIQA